MGTYTLTRVLPDGRTRAQTGLGSLRHVGRAVYFVLLDNRVTTSRKAATHEAQRVESARLGTPVEAFGYTFTVSADEPGGA